MRIGLSRKNCLWASLTATAFFAWGPNAFAFAEDICFPKAGGAPQNCTALPDVCKPVGSSNPACRAAAAALLGTEGLNPNPGARSMIHADATYLIAQAVGFSKDDAYWITAYDELCDYGSFEPYDMQGNAVGDGSLKTVEMDGFLRTNFQAGGTFFHYISIYNGGSGSPPSNIDGLHPDLQSPMTEFFLVHLRNWAMATRQATCTAGLTVRSDAGDYGTGSSCFTATYGGQALIHWSSAVIGPISAPVDNYTGVQVIRGADSGSPALSPQFDSVVGVDGTRAKNARLGIYIHSLADRISHHACTDSAAMAGPTKGKWTEEWTDNNCDQGYHALFHMWETGVDFTLVPSTNRTTEATLNIIYDELSVFAQMRGVLKSDASAKKAALVSAMLKALQTSAADARIRDFAKVSCDNGYASFPGAPVCTVAADAGTGNDASLADGGVTDDGGLQGLPGPPGGGSCDIADGGSNRASIVGVAGCVVAIAAFMDRRRRRSLSRS